MKINSDIQEIVDSKVDECAKDAEVAARHAWRAWRAGYARNTWCAWNTWWAGYARSARDAWRHYENQL